MALITWCALVGTGALLPLGACTTEIAYFDDIPDATNAPNTKKPPPRAGDKTVTDDSRFYALRTIQLGDTGWESSGYDLDGLVSTPLSSSHCKLRPGAPNKVKQDGDRGTDNSFGANVVPIFTTASPSLPKQINDTLSLGQFTTIIEVKGLNAAGDQTNIGLNGQLFTAGKMATAPKWDGSDEWSLLPNLLNDAKSIASGSTITFADSYVNGGVFVSGLDGTVILSLPLGTSFLDLTINKATISFRKPTSGVLVTEGTISGILNTEQFIAEFKKVAGALGRPPLLCEASTFENVASQIRQASDLMGGGANVEGMDCDAISVGIGFTAAEVKPPTKIQAAPAVPLPCTVP